MPPPTHHVHALIFGGGIAGLWTLARLRSQGYRALLLTTEPLGAGQTIASQGIIHGGIKYTLGLADASEAGRRIAEMPAIWRACLEGRGDVDLRDARVLTDHQHLWTTPGVLSRLAGFGASRMIRTAVARIEPDQRPAAFAGAPRGVDIYRVDEPVLAVDSVVRALADPHFSAIGRVEAPGGEGWIRFPGEFEQGGAIELPNMRITADRIILAAGLGNEVLMNRLWRAVTPLPQRRPLHMVVARFAGDAPPIFGHCLAPPPSTLPRLTITTAGNTWWIGGQIAETGVKRSEAEQIAHAREELRACVPWVDLRSVEVSTFRIDRAEGVLDRDAFGVRPDGPVIAESCSIIVGWPTKLAFAPAFAEDVLSRLRAAGITPESHATPPPSGALTHPGYAPYPWIASH